MTERVVLRDPNVRYLTSSALSPPKFTMIMDATEGNVKTVATATLSLERAREVAAQLNRWIAQVTLD